MSVTHNSSSLHLLLGSSIVDLLSDLPVNMDNESLISSTLLPQPEPNGFKPPPQPKIPVILPWNLPAEQASKYWIKQRKDRNDHTVDFDRVMKRPIGMGTVDASRICSFVILGLCLAGLFGLLIGHTYYQKRDQRMRSRQEHYISSMRALCRLQRLMHENNIDCPEIGWAAQERFVSFSAPPSPRVPVGYFDESEARSLVQHAFYRQNSRRKYSLLALIEGLNL